MIQCRYSSIHLLYAILAYKRCCWGFPVGNLSFAGDFGKVGENEAEVQPGKHLVFSDLFNTFASLMGLKRNRSFNKWYRMEGITPHEILLNMFTHFSIISSRISAIESGIDNNQWDFNQDYQLFASYSHSKHKTYNFWWTKQNKWENLWSYQIILILLHRFNDT